MPVRARLTWHWTWRPAVLALVAAGVALGGLQAHAEPPKTIEPGKLTIGINGDMPMTSLKDGKLIGTDGELIAAIAGKLGLEVNPVQMEWSALIQATKQGKVDLMLGSMGWTKERSEVMLLSDPIYYFGTFLLQKKASAFSTFEDMKGRSVGTVTGFTLVPELKSVPGIGEVKLYDTLDTLGALAGLGPFASIIVVRFKPSPAQWAAVLATLQPGGRVLLGSFRTAHHAGRGFPLAYCLDRAELVRLLATRLSLLSWRERDEGADLLAASVWERPAS